MYKNPGGPCPHPLLPTPMNTVYTVSSWKHKWNSIKKCHCFTSDTVSNQIKSSWSIKVDKVSHSLCKKWNDFDIVQISSISTPTTTIIAYSTVNCALYIRNLCSNYLLSKACYVLFARLYFKWYRKIKFKHLFCQMLELFIKRPLPPVISLKFTWHKIF